MCHDCNQLINNNHRELRQKLKEQSVQGERQWCSRSEGLLFEVSIWILEFELLDGPPGRRAIGDVVGETFWHAGVKDGQHAPITSKDQRARVALGREVARSLAIVVHGRFNRLCTTRLITDVCLQPRITSNGEVGGVAVLANNMDGMPILIEAIRANKEIARNSAPDPELAVEGELDARPIGIVWPKHLVKFVGSKLVS